MRAHVLKPIILLLVLLALASPCRAQSRAELVRLGKSATAFVEVGGGQASGSAFCVGAPGLFVTNAHVVNAIGVNAAVSLIVRGGEKEARKVTAHVIRLDRDADLALLLADGEAAAAPLQIGDSSNLYETQEVVIFGYPYGTDLALRHGSYPNVTVNVGRLTAFRKIDGKLAGLQFDSTIHPGNSGGPVLNAQGRVIGVVTARAREASNIAFAVPASRLREFLRKVEILFVPEVIPLARQHDPREFLIRVAAPGLPGAALHVDLVLEAVGQAKRILPARAAGSGAYRIAAVPVPVVAGPRQLQITVEDAGSHIVCRVPDRDMTVGGKPYRLSRLREIHCAPTPEVVLTDGQIVKGPIQGLDNLDTVVAGARVTLHLTQASRILVEDLDRTSRLVTYRIQVKQGGRVVAEKTGTLPFDGGPLQNGQIAGAQPPAPAPRGKVSFRPVVTYQVPEAGDIVTAGDLDGDGRPDVVIGGGAELGVLYGRGDGTLEPYTTLLPWKAGAGNKAIADINGDGRPDILLTDGLGKLVILLNRGGRKFSDPVVQTVGNLSAICLADINRDGRPDIAASIWGEGGRGSVKILLNNGDGSFREVESFDHIGIVEGVYLADVNGDGRLDLAVSFETSTVDRSGVSLYFGDGKGHFQESQTYNLGSMNMPNPLLVDVNGDGKPDLLQCNYWGGNVAVLLNKGDGTFLPLTRYPSESYPIQIRMGDFDGDGYADLAVPNAGKPFLSIYRRRSPGIFEDPVQFPSGGDNCRSCCVVDLNRDGKPDLVTQNESSHTIGVLINDSAGK